MQSNTEIGYGTGAAGERDINMVVRLKAFLSKHRFWIICGSMLLLQLLFSLRFMGRQYFSLDEVSQIGFIVKKHSFGHIIDYYLTSEVTNLPAFPILAALWYRAVPYGEGWMRLLTVLLTSAALVVLVKAAKELRGERLAYLMAMLLTISSLIMHSCSLTFRCHGFWLLFTALTLWRYFIRRNESPEGSFKNILILGLAMVGLAWSHYFGCITIVYLFLADCILWFRKRIQGKFVISYLIAGGSLFPWFILMISKRTMDLSSFWPKAPTFASIPRAFRYLVSKDETIFVLLIISILAAVISSAVRIFKGRPDYGLGFTRLSLALMPVCIIFGNYIYSAHISSSGGIFVMRYYLSVMPAALFSVALLMEDILDAVISNFLKASPEKGCIVYGTVILFFLIYFGAPNYYVDVKEEVDAPFDNTYGNVRDAVLNAEGGVEGLASGEAVLAIHTNRANADGFEEYYMERGGREADISVVSNEDDDIAERFEKAERVYVYQVMNGTPELYFGILKNGWKQVSFDKDIGLYIFERVPQLR